MGETKFRLLSFRLSAAAPAPGARTPLSLRVDESIEQGHLGNTFYYTAWNHAGTHIDAPAHMLRAGKPITDFQIHDFIFEHPCVVDVPKGDSQLITSVDLQPYEGGIAKCDLLLLRTGFTRYRATDPVRYRDQNSGLSTEVAHYLSSTRFPLLRAIGIDTISMAATAHVLEGVQAHKNLFAREDGSSVFLIEDVDLTSDLTQLQRVFVVPLFIEGLDSSPCTIIAEIEAKTE